MTTGSVLILSAARIESANVGGWGGGRRGAGAVVVRVVGQCGSGEAQYRERARRQHHRSGRPGDLRSAPVTFAPLLTSSSA